MYKRQIGNFVRLMFYNGPRASSYRNLKWTDITEDGNGGGYAYLYKTKSGKDVVLPLIPEAWAILESHPRVGRSPYVFSHFADDRGWTRSELYSRVKNLFIAAGLPNCDPTKVFRRNLAATARKQNLPDHLTAKLGGWESVGMVEYYAGKNPALLMEAAGVMSRKPKQDAG